MKWHNKGHEFDDIGEFFRKNKKIIVLGANFNSISCVKDKLQFVNLNNNVETKLVNKLFFKLLKRFGSFLLPSNIIVVVTDDSDNIYRRLLKNKHFRKEINIFKEEEFFNKYLSIYAVYVLDKVYFPSNSFICTTVCSLNCKDCLNYAPFDKNKKHYDIERLKKNADVLFNAVDRVGLFHISGGEPFSYPHLSELLNYLHNNYSDKIETLCVVTNMTLMPSDELCETLKKCNVLVQMDNYLETNVEKREQYNKILIKLNKYEINVDEIIAGSLWNWVSTFPPKRTLFDEKALIEKFNCCGSIFQEIKDGKLFSCCYSEFISQAGIFDYKKEDYYDLNNYNPDCKKELVEFRLKYNTYGYVEFCKYCNGLPPYNVDYVQPAIQADGYFDWDINNPTKLLVKESREV